MLIGQARVNFRLLDEVVSRLPAENPRDTSLLIDGDILFLADKEFLASPLGDWSPGPQFDREPAL